MQPAIATRLCRWVSPVLTLVSQLASGSALSPAQAEEPAPRPPAITAATSLRLTERGAILAEDFDGPQLNLSCWRVWQQNPEATSVRQEHGRLVLSGRGPVGHNGLFGLINAKYKDVVLAGEMDIRSQGPAPHRLALHLCGGDGARSPDHWVEIDLVDLGDKARFSPMAALPIGLDRQQDKFLELPHPAGRGFLCRLSLNGDTNLVELSVKTDTGWRAVCPPVALPLRTVHTEIKLHGSQAPATGAANAATESQAWFDNVRMYPRPECHHVGIRLVRPNGRQIWFRENDGWPPKIVDAAGKTRSIEDLEVQLWTEGGKAQVASVRSANMGFYLLPLKNAPWDVYPVAAEVRVVLDGKPLGPPQRIKSQGVHGLYPDDVYNLVIAEQETVARVDGSEKPLAERIAGRTYPSVFQAWSPAENVKERWSWQSLWGGSAERTAERTAARHDLIFSTPEYFGLRWNDRHAGLATGFTPESIKRGREYRTRLLELNPNLILLSELRYREGLYSPPGFWQQGGEFPQDSELWLRDQDGRLCPGWGEDADGDGTVERHEIQQMLLDFRNSKLHESIAARALALKETGLFDGIMLDWWNEHGATTSRWPDSQGSVLTRDEELAARLAILRTIRQRVGDDFLILVNANDRTVPQSAPYVNGLFMECWKPRYDEGYAPERFDQIAATLRWAEEHLKQPRINCVEGWRIVSELAGDRTTRIKERDSEANRKWMRLFTTLSLTHSDGYVLFGDDNAQPAPDHLHNWYPFWDKSLGRPVAKGHKADDGSFQREFDQGTAVCNPPGNRPVTVSFTRPHQSLATGQTAQVHQIAECDGDIFVQAGSFTRIQSEFIPLDTDDVTALPGPFALLDLDGDGQQEVVFVLLGYPKCAPQPVQVLRLEAGVLRRDDRLWSGSPPQVRHSTQISQIDINQDGQQDLVVSDAGLDYEPFTGSRLALCLGARGKYTDQSALLPREVWSARSYALGVGTLNQADGPILFYPRQSSDAANGIVAWKDGKCMFEPDWIDMPRKFLSYAECARLADFDGDGNTDVYLGGNAYTPGNTLFWGTGESTLRNAVTGKLPTSPFGFTPWEDYQQSRATHVEGGSCGPVAVIDVDGDGLLDIVAIWERVHTFTSGKAPNDTGGWANGRSAYLDEQLQVLKNNGGRSFTDISDRTIDRNFGHVYFRCVLPVDINLDGRIDLVGPYTDKKSGEFGTLLMVNDGTGRFRMINVRELLGDAAHVNPGTRRPEAGAFLPLQITDSGIVAALVSPVSGPRGRFGYLYSTVVSPGLPRGRQSREQR